MKINLKYIFLTICLFGLSSGQDLECFVSGECTESVRIESTTAGNEVQEPILPNFHFSGFPIFSVKLESL